MASSVVSYSSNRFFQSRAYVDDADDVVDMHPTWAVRLFLGGHGSKTSDWLSRLCRGTALTDMAVKGAGAITLRRCG
jgi:hypothetical protein